MKITIDNGLKVNIELLEIEIGKWDMVIKFPENTISFNPGSDENNIKLFRIDRRNDGS